MVIKNTCVPQSIYGGYTQTLFLGMSVLDFSATAGWNEQASTVTIKLVEDTCAGPRDYFDDNFNWKTGINFPNGDPGFNNAPVGSAAFFKVASFEFAGLIQSYNVTEDAGGNPVLMVTLISPTVVLDGVQVITDGYQGSVYSMPNVFNVYGFLESLGGNCPQVGGFGAPSGGFGFARRNDRGIPWVYAKPALQVLLGGATTSQYSWHGGITYKQGLLNNRYGSIRSEGYIVDITDLPVTNDIYYRLSNGNYTLTELISEVCSDGGYEYYVDLVPCKGGPTPPITNLIKIRTVSRRSQPALGEISSFITSQNQTSAGKIITQDSIGQELRIDSPNSAFIVGAQKQQIFEQTTPSFLYPFWGYNDDGGFNPSSWNTAPYLNQWQVELDVRALNLSLNTPIPATSVTVSESTLCAAMASQDHFLSWLQANDPGGDLANYFFTTLSLVSPFNLQLGAAKNEPAGDAARPDGRAAKDPKTPAARDADTVFGWLQSFVNETYGKKWFVAIPWVCWTYDPETSQILQSDQPATDGGWPTALNVLGMDFPTSYTDFFANENGTINTVVKFEGAISTALLGSDDYVTDGTSVWIKGELHDKWAILPATYFGAQYAAALVTIPNRVTVQPTLALGNVLYGGANLRAAAIPTDYNPKVNPAAVSAPGGLPFFAPSAAAIPVKSNTTAYGPWLATASDVIVNGHPFGGKIYYEKDDGLSPWEYGAYTYMNLGAAAKINNSITNQTTAERGAVTIAGYPEKSLGLAITDSPSLLQSRVLQNGQYQGYNYYYVNTGGVSTKAAQITNISVTVGASAITTEYQISSFTPVFGRFSKGNAERIKQIGTTRLQIGRAFRAAEARKSRLALGAALGKFAFLQQFAILNQANSHGSPGYYLHGKQFSSGRRNVVTSPSLTESSFYDEFDDTALMTMDGFFKPVQKRSASSSLPKEVEDPGPPGYQPNYSEAPAPPLNEYTQIRVSTDYLDFLGNPNSDIATRSNVPASGHNIEGVSRGVKTNYDGQTGLFSIPKAEEEGLFGYASDYRYLALRGPLVVHGWGYDVMGKPVPNANGDSEGNWGSSYANLKDTFADAWLQNDKLWPTAPVDLRYDRKRGVWTIPPGFRIYKVRAESPGDPAIAPGGAGSVEVLNAGDVYDAAGNAITTKTVTITNITSSETPEYPNTYLAYYDNYNDVYYPIFPGSGSGSPICVEYDPNFLEGCVTPPNNLEPFQTLRIGRGLYGESFSSASCDGEEKSGLLLKTIHTISALNQCPQANPVAKHSFGNIEFGNGLIVTEEAQEGGTVPSPEGSEQIFCGYKIEAPLLVSGRRGTATLSSPDPFALLCVPFAAPLEDANRDKTFHLEFDGAIALYKKTVDPNDATQRNPDSTTATPAADLCNTYVAKVCTPKIWYKPCNGEKTSTGYRVHQYNNILYDGFKLVTAGLDAGELGVTESDGVNNSFGFNLHIKHEHLAKGGCEIDPQGNEGEQEGKPFQDIIFSESFRREKTNSQSIPSSPTNQEACQLKLHLCGLAKEVEVVCDVACEGNTQTYKKTTLTFEEGLLKNATDCEVESPETASTDSARTASAVVGLQVTTTQSTSLQGNTSSAVGASASVGPITITLPLIAEQQAYAIYIAKTDGTTNAVTIQQHADDGGATVATLTNQYEVATLIPIANVWFQI